MAFLRIGAVCTIPLLQDTLRVTQLLSLPEDFWFYLQQEIVVPNTTSRRVVFIKLLIWVYKLLHTVHLGTICQFFHIFNSNRYIIQVYFRSNNSNFAGTKLLACMTTKGTSVIEFVTLLSRMLGDRMPVQRPCSALRARGRHHWLASISLCIFLHTAAFLVS